MLLHTSAKMRNASVCPTHLNTRGGWSYVCGKCCEVLCTTVASLQSRFKFLRKWHGQKWSILQTHGGRQHWNHWTCVPKFIQNGWRCAITQVLREWIRKVLFELEILATLGSLKDFWLKMKKYIVNHLWLTFLPGAWLHIKASRHGWHQECHAGLDGMGLCLHDNNHLGRLEGDLMEGQRQGLEASSFPGCHRLLVVWVRARGADPGEGLGRGVLGRGGWGGRGLWLTGGVPRVVW